MKKRVAIIGATGSVGSAGVEVVKANSNIFETLLLTAHSNEKGLLKAKEILNAKHTILTSKENSHNDIINIIKKI